MGRRVLVGVDGLVTDATRSAAAWGLVLGIAATSTLAQAGPRRIGAALPAARGAVLVSWPDGTVRRVWIAEETLFGTSTASGGRVWTAPAAIVALPGALDGGCAVQVDPESGEVTVIYGTATELCRRQTTGRRADWLEPGAIGSFAKPCPGGVTALADGRWVLAFHHTARTEADGFGVRDVGVAFSEDSGANWTLSEAALRAPVRADSEGAAPGASDPVVVPLDEDRVWLLCSTQLGRLFQSWSTDGGASWLPLRPARFPNPGTAAGVATDDGEIYLLGAWAAPDATPGAAPVAAPALHAAVTEDGGASWAGVRALAVGPWVGRPSVLIRGDELWATGGATEGVVAVARTWLKRGVKAAEEPPEGAWRGEQPTELAVVPIPDSSEQGVPIGGDAGPLTLGFPLVQAGRIGLRLFLPRGTDALAIEFSDQWEPLPNGRPVLRLEVAGGRFLDRELPTGRWIDVELSFEPHARGIQFAVDRRGFGSPSPARDPLQGLCFVRFAGPDGAYLGGLTVR